MAMRASKVLGPVLLAVALVLGASSSQADVVFTVDSSRPDGSAVGVLAPGDEVVLDITVRTDGEYVGGMGAAVYGFDPSAASLVSGITSTAALVLFATGPGSGLGGLDSSQSVSLDLAGGDAGIQFFNGISLSGTVSTGANDISPVNGLVGGPQFQVVMAIHESLTLWVGAGHPTDGVLSYGGYSPYVVDSVLSLCPSRIESVRARRSNRVAFEDRNSSCQRSMRSHSLGHSTWGDPSESAMRSPIRRRSSRIAESGDVAAAPRAPSWSSASRRATAERCASSSVPCSRR